jgi:acyl-CoA synthetase (AMP-forming)/AMP-acid ligase II
MLRILQGEEEVNMLFEKTGSTPGIQHTESETLVTIIQRHAQTTPDRVLGTFLVDGENVEVKLTYRELDQGARFIAGAIRGIVPRGSRALLLYPPGIDFITAFFGCFYAGVTAVPTPPPLGNLKVERLESVITDAEPLVICTTDSLIPKVTSILKRIPGAESIRFIATDQLEPTSANWDETNVNREDLAFLQYTSGSTTTPRGVMISHGNLLENISLIKRAFGCTKETRHVSWLPPFHDMGLIGGIFTPAYIGCETIFMSPLSFLQRPSRWLKAISKYRADICGGPNFGYDLCVQKISPEEREHMDLSGWKVAYCGAEQIRSDTLDRFARYFSPCGFSHTAYLPCYGLAESTLMVSHGALDSPPVIKKLNRNQLENGTVSEVSAETAEHAHILVGCGTPIDNHDVVVVDPETCSPCTRGRIGEIWVSGPCIAKGYWKQPRLTQEVFGASPAGSSPGNYLRTGDLGFIEDGQLFITGRIKELIILDGANYYPHDIETVAQKSHPALMFRGGAAFSYDHANQERLVLVHEVDRKYIKSSTYLEIKKAVIKSVTRHFDIKLHDFILVYPGRIPRTTSGKIQRNLCKRKYLQGEIEALSEDIFLKKEG